MNPKLVTDNFGAYFILFPKKYICWNKNTKDMLSQLAMRYKKTKLVQSKVKTKDMWKEKMCHLLSTPVAEKFVENNLVENDSLLLMAYGNKKEVVTH